LRKELSPNKISVKKRINKETKNAAKCQKVFRFRHTGIIWIYFRIRANRTAFDFVQRDDERSERDALCAENRRSADLG
jgi:hypothetical protein